MKIFFRIILILILLISVALAWIYYFYKDDLLEKAKIYLESELSRHLESSVQIGSMGYIPLQSVWLDHVTLSRQGAGEQTILAIDNVTITANLPLLIKRKKLKTTTGITGLHVGNTSCDALIKTVSHKTDTYKKVLDLGLVDSVFIIKAFARGKNFAIQDIIGNFEIEDMAVFKGKIHFVLNGVKYLADFSRKNQKNDGYNLAVRSDNLNFQSTLLQDGNHLTIDNMKGMFYTLNFDLKGTLWDYLSQGHALYSLKGIVNAKLETFNKLPGKIGKFAGSHPVNGTLRSHINFKTKELGFENYKFSTTTFVDDLRIENYYVKEIVAKTSLEDGKFLAPFISGTIYDGSFVCNTEIDLIEKNIPYLLSVSLNHMDFSKFMSDVSNGKIKIQGRMASNFSVKGYAGLPETAEGNGNMAVLNANLGPMPILTPLLGDVFSTVQNIIPGWKKTDITQAYADFDIKNRKIQTSNLTLLGEDITITAEGYIDFDGNLDFIVENRLREPPPDQDNDWQIMLRNAIVNFGKVINKKRLHGTIKNPKWGLK